MRPLLSILLLAASGSILLRGIENPATRGRELYEKRCSGCHGLDTLKVGPPLRAAFGRRAASDPKFPYSEGLKKASLVWDETTLNRWLADPEALVPDNDMSFRLDQADERSAIVSYLKQLSPQKVR